MLGTSPTDARPSSRARLLVAFAAGLMAMALAWWASGHGDNARTDFLVQWVGAHAVRAGADPYQTAGPGLAFHWPARIAYPLPTLVALVPFTLAPARAAGAVFAGLSVGALAWALAAAGWGRLWVLASWPLLHAVLREQWAPWLAAAALVPGLAWVAAMKPTIGAALLVYRPSVAWWRGAAVVGAGLALAAWGLQPDWVGAWLAALRAPPDATVAASGSTAALYLAPITRPFGWLVLAALLRWRRPEARLLVALACVPQTMTAYEFVPVLALVPATWREAALLAGLSWALLVGWFVGFPYPDLTAAMLAGGARAVWCVFLPATLLVLARQNVGPADHVTPPATPPAEPRPDRAPGHTPEGPTCRRCGATVTDPDELSCYACDAWWPTRSRRAAIAMGVAWAVAGAFALWMLAGVRHL